MVRKQYFDISCCRNPVKGMNIVMNKGMNKVLL